VRRLAAFGAGLVFTALAIACAANTSASGDRKPSLGACAGGRSQVKTLSDRRAVLVNDRPRETSVAALRRLRTPAGLTATSPRRPGAERRTYRIQVRLVEMTLEKDGDIILVVLDPKTKAKLATEFPAANCTRGASSHHRKLMGSARAALIAACGKPTTSTTEIGGSATVTGVGFFEPGDGVAPESPNRFELHPVVGFRSGRCPIGARPHSASTK
jgi:hypothetical protein